MCPVRSRFDARFPGHAAPGFDCWATDDLGEQGDFDCALAEYEFHEREQTGNVSELPREDWVQRFRAAIEQWVALAGAKRNEFLRVARLEREVEELKTRISRLGHPQSVIVPITTFEPEAVELLRDIPVVVQPTNDGYLATAFDLNMGMTGDNAEEAVANLKALIVDMFDELEQDEDNLGPVPAMQLAVLRRLVRRRET